MSFFVDLYFCFFKSKHRVLASVVQFGDEFFLYVQKEKQVQGTFVYFSRHLEIISKKKQKTKALDFLDFFRSL